MMNCERSLIDAALPPIADKTPTWGRQRVRPIMEYLARALTDKEFDLPYQSRNWIGLPKFFLGARFDVERMRARKHLRLQ